MCDDDPDPPDDPTDEPVPAEDNLGNRNEHEDEHEDDALRERLTENAKVVRRGEAFGNDPFINDLVREAENDNALAERGSLVPLFVHINHARRLAQAQERGLKGYRYEAFAKRIANVAKNKAHKLRILHDFAMDILKKCETDSAMAHSRGQPYLFPTWRVALAWFYKPPKTEPEGEDDTDADAEPEDLFSVAANATIDLLTEQLAESNVEVGTITEKLTRAQQHLDESTTTIFTTQQRIAQLEQENQELRAQLAAYQNQKPPEDAKPPEEATPEEAPKRKRGWPKGKPRKPKLVVDNSEIEYQEQK